MVYIHMYRLWILNQKVLLPGDKIYPKHASPFGGVLLWVTSAKPFRKCEEVQANSQEHTGKCMEKPGVD